MPLELDAAVAYGVCYPKFLSGKYCDVSLANIVDNIPVDSVYNTYREEVCQSARYLIPDLAQSGPL